MRTTTRSRPRGFTLVELLVALFIMAIMAGLAWRGIDGMARARDAGQQRMEQALRLDTVVTQWEQDLAALHDVGGDLSFGYDGAAVRLTRRADEGGVRLVVWQLRNGELLRWAGRPVTRLSDLQEQWMRSLQFLGTEPGQVHALKGVTALRLFCFRDNAWSNCQSTGDVAAAPAPAAPASGAARAVQQQVLPSGLRLTLEFNGSPLAGSLTRDVLLPPQQLAR
jgi:general secretion pathway protein J